jgi:hypothetical protein
MSGITLGLLLASLLVVGACASLVPLILPWRQRVRWTVLSQVTHAFGIPGAVGPQLDLREVTVGSISTHGGNVTLTVSEPERPVQDTVRISGPRPPADELALLQDWRDLRTPLLLYLGPSSTASLHGPTFVIAGLQRVPEITPDRIDGGSTRTP